VVGDQERLAEQRLPLAMRDRGGQILGRVGHQVRGHVLAACLFLPLQIPADEAQGLVVRLGHALLVAAGQAVTGAAHGDQLMDNLVPREFLGHGRGLFIGNVRVLGAVHQQGRRKLGRDGANRTVRIELVALLP
jgi:hypothetical protein